MAEVETGCLEFLPAEYGRAAYPRGPGYPIGISGIGTSSSDSSSVDSDVRLPFSSSSRSSSETSSSLLSLEDSVHVDGSYSCFSGDEERRLFLKAGRDGTNTGVLDPFSEGVTGLADRWGGGGGGLLFSASD